MAAFLKKYLRILLSVAIIFSSTTARPQIIDGSSIPELLSRLSRTAQDSNRVNLLVALGKQYVLKIGTLKSDMDSAMLLAREAEIISKNLHYEQGIIDARLLTISTLLEQDLRASVHAMLRSERNPDIQVGGLQQLGENYLNIPNPTPAEKDSTLSCVRQAEAIASSMKNDMALSRSYRLLGHYYFDMHAIGKGIGYFLQAVDLLRHNGHKKEEANVWIDLGFRIPDHDTTFDRKVEYVTHSVTLYHDLGERELEVWALRTRAEILRRQGKLDLAESELKKILTLQQTWRFKNLHSTYNILIEIALFRGQSDQALQYALESVKSMERSGDSVYSAFVYEKLGNIYHELGDASSSLGWYTRAASAFLNAGDYEPVSRIESRMAEELITLGRPQDALSLLRAFKQDHSPRNALNKEVLAGAFGASYQALKMYPEAERYFQEMIGWEERMHPGGQLSANAYYLIGRFYFEAKQYYRAGSLIDTDQRILPGRVSLARLKDIHLMLFGTDSVAGRYSDAIKHLQTYLKLNDSLFNSTKSRQLAEIATRYETEKREKEVQNLRRQSTLQETEILQAGQLRRITYACIGLLLLLLALTISRYRIKQRNQYEMEAKQKEITTKNDALQKLVKEKEWLVKEIHHRVKNNLQIVISLLSAQSDFLENDLALKAIRESGHRMQAISLIHQRLYLPGNPESIEMSAYIRELITYLKESYAVGGRIYFQLDIGECRLDVSQAVSVGLILNEAITNALKYAFPDNRIGSIRISLDHPMPGCIRFQVSDDGIGLPQGMDFSCANTLGIRLMQTMSEQLEGRLLATSEGGVTITLNFKQQ